MTYDTAMASLDHKTEVGWESSSVASTRSFFVGIRTRHVIGEFARTLEHLALVVRPVFILDFLGHALHLVYGVRNTDEVAPGDAVERVTGGADFTVDHVAAAYAVECAGA